MKQIDYFKIVKAFPQLIDINDTVEVKLALLKELRRVSLRSKEFVRLLPVKVWRNLISPEELREKGFLAPGYIIKNKKKSIFKIAVIEEHTYVNHIIGQKFPYVDMQKPYNHFEIDIFNRHYFMTQDEVKNMKRTLLIDNMLKDVIR